MSSRKQQKEHARAERVERQRAAAAADRRRRLVRLSVAAVTATVALVAVVAINQGSDSPEPATGGAADAAGVNATFRGIPQDGVALGNPQAPVTLTEFADLQCPFCAQFATDVLPKIIDRYVRHGRVRIMFRNLTFLGSDSQRAAQAAAAAAEQDRLWQFAELFYRNQGPENSGYVTDEFIGKLARGVHLDAKQVVARANDPTQDPSVARAATEADRFGISGTPSFLIARRGERPRKLDLSGGSVQELSNSIDQGLRKR